jgi:hypothetical protein
LRTRERALLIDDILQMYKEYLKDKLSEPCKGARTTVLMYEIQNEEYIIQGNSVDYENDDDPEIWED